jgi:hypothetical protein
MTVGTINSNSRPHSQTLAVVAVMSRIVPGIETKWRCRENLGDKFIFLNLVLSPQRFCKLCKLLPPVFARVPAMEKIIADRSTLPKAETPMRSMALPGFNYRQRLNLHRPGCCKLPPVKKLDSFLIPAGRVEKNGVNFVSQRHL